MDVFSEGASWRMGGQASALGDGGFGLKVEFFQTPRPISSEIVHPSSSEEGSWKDFSILRKASFFFFVMFFNPSSTGSD